MPAVEISGGSHNCVTIVSVTTVSRGGEVPNPPAGVEIRGGTNNSVAMISVTYIGEAPRAAARAEMAAAEMAAAPAAEMAPGALDMEKENSDPVIIYIMNMSGHNHSVAPSLSCTNITRDKQLCQVDCIAS